MVEFFGAYLVLSGICFSVCGGLSGVGRGAAADPMSGGAGHIQEDPRSVPPGSGDPHPQRLCLHQKPVQPDVSCERATAAVAGAPAEPQPTLYQWAAARERAAATGTRQIVSGMTVALKSLYRDKISTNLLQLFDGGRLNIETYTESHLCIKQLRSLN